MDKVYRLKGMHVSLWELSVKPAAYMFTVLITACIDWGHN